MLKLLIVDDEYNIREGLAKAVDWGSVGAAAAGTASGGAEALQLYDRLSPDIVITDIFMDEMNGLDLIEAISRKNRNTKFILISGYDEFEYARKAIDLKVFRYLLKPVLPAEILSAVRTLSEEIREEQELRRRIGKFEEEIGKNRDILTRQLRHDVLHGLAGPASEYAARAALLSCELRDAPCVCIAIEADGKAAPEDENPYWSVRMLALGICRVAEEVFARLPGSWAYSDDDGRVYLVAAKAAHDFEQTLAYCIERLQKVADRSLGVTVSVGVGGECGGLGQVCQSRREAMRALEYKMAAGKESVIHIRDVLSIDARRFVYPTDEERRILDALAMEDGEGLRDAVGRFFAALSAERVLDNRIKAAVVKLSGVVSMKLNELNAPAPDADVLSELEKRDTLDSVRKWFLGVATQALSGLSESRVENIRSVIHSAENYIQMNFRDMSLSLSAVAEHMGLTPSYFSRLFKQETGRSYIDYVINLRIEFAKRLLRTTPHRIFDIGEMVGYPNSQYFCTLFRRVCGVSPAEYREGRDAP